MKRLMTGERERGRVWRPSYLVGSVRVVLSLKAEAGVFTIGHASLA